MNEQSASSRWPSLRRNWLNWRAKRFWVVLALLAYTAIGFLLLPWLVRSTAIETVRADYDRELRIAEVRFNPYTFTLQINGLALADTDGEPLVAFDRLVVNFTLASLLNRAWTFQTVHLDGLALQEERFADGTSRFARLVEDLTPPVATEGAVPEPEAKPDGGPSLLIEDLRLDAGRVRFVDHLPDETVSFVLDPISVTLNGLDTRPNREGRNTVRVALESGGNLTWDGTVQLAPLRSAGRIELNEIVLDPLLPYLRRFAALSGFRLTLDGGFDYNAGLAEDGPELTVSGGTLALRDLGVSGFDPAVEFLATEAVRAEGIAFNLGERRARVDSLAVEEPRFRTWLTEQGELGLLTLLPEENNEADPAAETAGQTGAPLALELGALRVNGLAAEFEDRSTEPATRLGLNDVSVQLDDFTTEDGARFPARIQGTVASGGGLEFDGRLGYRPAFTLSGTASVTDLKLEPAQAYLQQFARVRLDNGAFNLDGELGIGPGEPFSYRGSASVQTLDVKTADAGEPVLGWAAVRVETLDLSLGGRRVETSPVVIEQPSATFVIAEDKTTNIGRLLVQRAAEERAAQDGEATQEPLAVTLGGVRVAGGRLDFADYSLPLPFSTRIADLDGGISTLATESTEPANVDLEGQVGDNGLARIDGSINTWAPARFTDIRMEFRNLKMPDYSPYTVQFAGRRIADGNMDLDLAYRLDEGQLRGDNDIVLRDLELGEKVDSPDAADLPLGLAVALLKDADGVIDIALPVSGDVNDPQFDIAGVIRQVLATTIRDIVKSPFRLLGSILGLGSEDLGTIEFLAGRSDLTPPQREKTGKLAAALEKRPQLALEIAGTYAPSLDEPALRRQQALAALRERLGKAEGEDGELSLTDKAVRDTVRALFMDAYPDADLDALRERFTRPPEDKPDAEAVFDEVAWQAHLASRIIEAQSVSRTALESLAGERASAVRAALVSGGGSLGGGIEEARLRVVEPRETDTESNSRVPLALSVTTR
ncbi:DUF748 domain-containing protein [Ectothiorhodospiraceae bacterium WFHF3C12]|nr:DUF748 domain-containing protein [Ectothiorhodospiraceae bacterium WFHF3C12]